MATILVDFYIALRNIARQKRRSLIAASAVAFGVAALIVASGFVEWMLHTFREEAIRSQFGHLQVVRPGYHTAGKADPYAFLLPEQLPALHAATPSREIKAVAPRLSFSGLLSHAESTLSFIGEGVSPSAEAAFGEVLQIVAGSNLAADTPRAAILGVGLARNLGIGVGDRVVLLATTASGGTNAVEVTVAGLFATVSKAYDDAAIRLPIETARELIRTQGLHAWVVLLHDTSDTGAMLSRMRTALSQKDFDVVPWYQLADTYNKTAALFRTQVEGVRLILALIIFLGILNTVTISVMERTGEIGTAMALGVRRRGVLRLFVSEGVLLGIFGGGLGVVLGLVLSSVISAVGIPMPPPPGVSHGYTSAVMVNPRIVLEALMLAIFTTLIASIYPAWTASRKKIVDALRHNR